MAQLEADEEEEGLYGLLQHRNIDNVVFGELQFDTWYGCSMYFTKDKRVLGTKFQNDDENEDGNENGNENDDDFMSSNEKNDGSIVSQMDMDLDLTSDGIIPDIDKDQEHVQTGSMTEKEKDEEIDKEDEDHLKMKWNLNLSDLQSETQCQSQSQIQIQTQTQTHVENETNGVNGVNGLNGVNGVSGMTGRRIISGSNGKSSIVNKMHTINLINKTGRSERSGKIGIGGMNGVKRKNGLNEQGRMMNGIRRTNGINSNIHDDPNIDEEGFWLETLYVCDYCFKYTDDAEELKTHREYCLFRERLPGRIKYKDDEKDFMIRKVRGSRNELFCQCLSLFGKLFLDTKSIFFHVMNFEFYVVYGKVEQEFKPMGFFSKELLSWEENNLACICVFPPYQRHRLGSLLISFSYELSKFQGLISGPELPLSSFGKIGYIRYWTSVLVYELIRGRFSCISDVTIDQLSRFTGIRANDISTTLQYLGCLVKKNDRLYLMRGNIVKWINENNFSFDQALNKDCLILE